MTMTAINKHTGEHEEVVEIESDPVIYVLKTSRWNLREFNEHWWLAEAKLCQEPNEKE